MNEQTAKKAPSRIVPAVLAGLVLLLAAAGFILYRHYALAGGQLVSVKSETLDLQNRNITRTDALRRCVDLRSVDLRGNPLPAAELFSLREALPGCEILCDVPLGGQLYDSETPELTLEDLPEDWENLTLFNSLHALTVERCTAPETMSAAAAVLPGCALRWSLSLGGAWYDTAAETIDLPAGAADFDELGARLGFFAGLRSLSVPDDILTAGEQRALAGAFPAVRFHWPVAVDGRLLSSDTTELILEPGEALNLAALDEALDLLPALRRVELTGSAVPGADRAAFLDAHPELEVSWTVELLGETYPWDTPALDFNNVPLADTAEIEAALPYLPRLETVEMCDTGLSNETMDELNRRYENVKFVWRVYFSGYKLRTDAEYFIAASFGDPPPAINNQHLEILRYCTEMRGLDLGHMYFTDLSFIQSMPHMTYLILAESSVTDLSPLAGLQELKYLEIFKTGITDLSPLLECPALEDLNICYTWVGADNAMEVLPQMKQLERLWWCNTSLSGAQQAQLQEALPECITFFLRGGESSGGIWRYHDNYYEMRDFFHMYYMPGGTNGVDDDGAQIIVDDRGREYHLRGYDYSYQRWWEDPRYSGYHPYIIGITA